MIESIKDLAVSHPYYCMDEEYFKNESTWAFGNFGQFLQGYKEADIDLNLCFRFDLFEDFEDCYKMKLFMIHQRKGIFMVYTINNIKESDLPAINEYLSKHYKRLQEMWEPFSSEVKS